MQTLSYGYKLPETNDKGTIVFPALEDNIQQVNDHDHDGANSAQITARAILADSQTAALANWVSVGNGLYRQLMSLLAGYSFDTVTLSVRLTSGHYIVPTIEKVSASQFYIYTNDNSIDLVIVYGV